MRNEEQFFAWLDGELHGEAAERVAAEVAADPELQRLAEQHRALAASLRTVLEPVACEEVPAPLQAAARPAGEVIDFGAARGARTARPPIWKQVAAMAATLALGIAAGNMFFDRSSVPIQQEGGQLVAAAGLEDALFTRLASAPADEGPRIGLTFRDRSGNICRSFTDGGTSGLACHEGGGWRIRGMFQAPSGAPGNYRMAFGSDPQLAGLIEQQMQGEPFDLKQESAAKENGWR